MQMSYSSTSKANSCVPVVGESVSLMDWTS